MRFSACLMVIFVVTRVRSRNYPEWNQNHKERVDFSAHPALNFSENRTNAGRSGGYSGAVSYVYQNHSHKQGNRVLNRNVFRSNSDFTEDIHHRNVSTLHRHGSRSVNGEVKGQSEVLKRGNYPNYHFHNSTNSVRRNAGAHRHGNKGISEDLSRDGNQAINSEMEKLMVVDANTGIQYNPYSKHHTGRHVCTRNTNDKPIKTKQPYCKPTFKNYVIRCQGNQICKGVRLVYETHYKDVVTTKTSNEIVYGCCPGWTQITNRSHGCHKATCSKPCLNGGKCVKPNVCACQKGFSGQQCEIPINTPLCTKVCENGGTCIQNEICECSAGYTGRYCEKDIDECKTNKPCDQICYNTPGSFYCQCKEDFALQKDGQTCRKEDDKNDGGLEAKDLEFEMLDKRLLKLETMMDETHKNDVSKDDLKTVYREMNTISQDMSNLKSKIDDVENYKNDMSVFKTKLNSIEKKAEMVDELMLKYDRMKKCAFYNKICL